MSDHLDMSGRAATEAHALYNMGFYDGAIARAYYAMYHAARAALLHLDPKFALAKTHKGLLQQFSRLVSLTCGGNADLSRSMRRALNARIEIDYEARPATREAAMELVAAMDEFQDAIKKFIGNKGP